MRRGKNSVCFSCRSFFVCLFVLLSPNTCIKGINIMSPSSCNFNRLGLISVLCCIVYCCVWIVVAVCVLTLCVFSFFQSNRFNSSLMPKLSLSGQGIFYKERRIWWCTTKCSAVLSTSNKSRIYFRNPISEILCYKKEEKRKKEKKELNFATVTSSYKPR